MIIIKFKKSILLILSILTLLTMALTGCSNNSQNEKKWENCRLVNKENKPDYQLYFEKGDSTLIFTVDYDTYKAYDINSSYDISYEMRGTIPLLKGIDIPKESKDKF